MTEMPEFLKQWFQTLDPAQRAALYEYLKYTQPRTAVFEMQAELAKVDNATPHLVP